MTYFACLAGYGLFRSESDLSFGCALSVALFYNRLYGFPMDVCRIDGKRSILVARTAYYEDCL